MADTHITRCPHCQTTFRIRLGQLAASNGAVRCGSCLQVFKAADHLVSSASKAPAKPVAPIKQAPLAKAPVKPVAPIKQAPLAKAPVKPVTPSKPASPAKVIKAPVAAAVIPSPAKATIPVEDTADEEIPETFNDDPLEDFGIRQHDPDSNETFDNSLQLDDSIFSMQEKAKPSRYSLLDDKQDIDFGLNDSSSDESWTSRLMEDEKETPLKSSADDESWANALLDIDDALVDEIDMTSTKTRLPEEIKEEDDFVPSLEDEPETEQYHLGGNHHFEQEEVEIELTVADFVHDLLDEPLNLDNKGKKQVTITRGPSFLWLWFSGAILMILALVAQVGYFKFDSWSRNPSYRPAYTFTCQLLNCQLPAIQNIGKMKTQHFMVRPHPKVKQALYIDTLLVNTAEYKQPFPDLNLIFTGLNDQTIASRHFKPNEYLAGELSGSNSMPQNVPIHIAIEIANPGAEAVGYRIELIANH